MEMSRQRIRFGVVESSTHKCPTCNGTGLVRSVESVALMVMRNVEDHVLKKPGQSINVRVPVDVALYILNSKRGTLSTLELKNSLSINIVADDHVGPQHYVIEKGEPRINTGDLPPPQHVRVDTAAFEEADSADEVVEDEEEEEIVGAEAGEPREARGDEGGERGGRRRRRRRGGRDRDERSDRPERQPQPAVQAAQAAPAETSSDVASDDEDDDETEIAADANGNEPRDENGEPRRRRRRGRRGGRRNRRENGDVAPNGDIAPNGAAPQDEPAIAMSDEGTERVAAAVLAQDAIAADVGIEPAISVVAPAPMPDAEAPAAEAPPVEKPKRARRSRKAADADAVVQDAVPDSAESPARPKSRSRRPKAAPPTEAEAIQSAQAIAVAVPEPIAEPAASAEPAAEPAAPVVDEAPRRARKDLPADEIVVSSSSAKPADEKPRKAGWWQRGFFGG